MPLLFVHSENERICWRFAMEFFCLRHLGSKFTVDFESVIGEVGNDPTSSVPEERPTVESEVCHRSSDQGLTELQIVPTEEMS